MLRGTRNSAWPRGGRPTWADDHYGSIVSGGFFGGGSVYATVQSMVDPTQTESMHIRPGLSLDLAISGESDLLGYEEENWLKDCPCKYAGPIPSLEKLHNLKTRKWMRTEGPRWWRDPGNGGIVWMSSEFWGQ